CVSLLSISFVYLFFYSLFFFSSRRRHTRWPRDWSSDVCSSDLSGGCVLESVGSAGWGEVLMPRGRGRAHKAGVSPEGPQPPQGREGRALRVAPRRSRRQP